MWTVIKINHKKIELLKMDLKAKLGSDLSIYYPKISVTKKISKNKFVSKEIHVLGDYIFCFHNKFKETEVIKKLKFVRGIKYFLEGSYGCQIDIKHFIEKCKNSENKNGYMSQNFFNLKLLNEYKFSEGPFAESIFKIIEFQKNKLEILLGSLKTTVKKNDFLFRPV